MSTDTPKGFDLDAWLDEEVNARSQFDAPYKMSRADRISYLLSCNDGTFGVHRWGVISVNEAGHREGLEQHEAFELARYDAFFQALHVCGVPCYEIMANRLKSYQDNFAVVAQQAMAMGDRATAQGSTVGQ